MVWQLSNCLGSPVEIFNCNIPNGTYIICWYCDSRNCITALHPWCNSGNHSHTMECISTINIVLMLWSTLSAAYWTNWSDVRFGISVPWLAETFRSKYWTSEYEQPKPRLFKESIRNLDEKWWWSCTLSPNCTGHKITLGRVAWMIAWPNEAILWLAFLAGKRTCKNVWSDSGRSSERSQYSFLLTLDNGFCAEW